MIFLSNEDYIFIKVLKPLPVDDFAKILNKLNKQGYIYLDYGSFEEFFNKCCKKFKELDKKIETNECEKYLAHQECYKKKR